MNRKSSTHSSESREQLDSSVEDIRATIERIIDDKYIVTRPLEACGDLRIGESVTVSLPNWRGESAPQAGQVVILINTQYYSQGWRAESARPITARENRTQSKKEVHHVERV